MPLIAFGRHLDHAAVKLRDAGYDVIGLDWTQDPVDVRYVCRCFITIFIERHLSMLSMMCHSCHLCCSARVGPTITLQGNMDPCALYGTGLLLFFVHILCVVCSMDTH